jgi:hypothetical protein
MIHNTCICAYIFFIIHTYVHTYDASGVLEERGLPGTAPNITLSSKSAGGYVVLSVCVCVKVHVCAMCVYTVCNITLSSKSARGYVVLPLCVCVCACVCVKVDMCGT